MMKKGDTYCTLWTEGLAGPFTYDGKANIAYIISIEGEKSSLLLAQEGFRVMYEHTLDDEYDFMERIANFIRPEAINRAIDFYPDKMIELEELKKYSKRIKEIVGGR